MNYSLFPKFYFPIMTAVMLLSPISVAANDEATLSIAMECNNAPFSWTQTDDTQDALKISNTPDYSNGYDLIVAQRIADSLGMQLEIVKLDLDSAASSLASEEIDCIIGAQEINSLDTSVDYSVPYFYDNMVVLIRSDNAFASAEELDDLSEASCTSIINTTWYDALSQIEDAKIQAAIESVPQMLQYLVEGQCDLVVVDLATAMEACAEYPELTYLDFSDSDSNFEVLGDSLSYRISVNSENTELIDNINEFLDTFGDGDMEDVMDTAIKNYIAYNEEDE